MDFLAAVGAANLQLLVANLPTAASLLVADLPTAASLLVADEYLNLAREAASQPHIGNFDNDNWAWYK